MNYTKAFAVSLLLNVALLGAFTPWWNVVIFTVIVGVTVWWTVAKETDNLLAGAFFGAPILLLSLGVVIAKLIF